jgi:hypothetical protein
MSGWRSTSQGFCIAVAFREVFSSPHKTRGSLALEPSVQLPIVFKAMFGSAPPMFIPDTPLGWERPWIPNEKYI